ncbi:unnamed protein product [Trifolium pratense]|uniref:Uncharacterized protein n=1 Tax=Trifolium pratense TaxID=57577 RepID=A0ACB0M100_TRIPR|nr:unnamed protein product [Trifolium pratense]
MAEIFIKLFNIMILFIFLLLVVCDAYDFCFTYEDCPNEMCNNLAKVMKCNWFICSCDDD